MASNAIADASARTWTGFVIMCLGMFMAILDIQIVATSLPTIQAALHISTNKMVWIQTSYLTAEIVAIPLTGYLTGLLGMRWLFVGAVTAFTLASVGCGQSQNFETLIVWRIVQGFSGGTLIPAVFSAVFLLFTPRSQGLATTLAGVAAVLRRRSGRSLAAGSPKACHGTGCSGSTSSPEQLRHSAGWSFFAGLVPTSETPDRSIQARWLHLPCL